jgi:diguanylate cyclase (GGDEF)-like protein
MPRRSRTATTSRPVAGDVELQARQIKAALLVGAGFAFMIAAAQASLYPLPATLEAALGVTALALLAGVRRAHRPAVVRRYGHLTVGIFLLLQIAIVLTGGRFASAAVWWLALVPLLAATLCGERAARWWACGTGVLVVGLYWSESSLPYAAPVGPSTHFDRFFGLLQIMAVVTVLASVERRISDRHLAAAVQHEQELQEQSEKLEARVLERTRDLDEANAQLARLALHDPLTGLANRALLLQHLEHALAVQSRRGGSVAVLFADLDRFKVVNDSLGHLAGDAVLQVVAARLTAAVRPSDVVARLGGDEFAVVIDTVSDADEVAAIAERVRRACSEPLSVQGREVFATASVGVAFATDGAARAPRERAVELLQHADVAMYEAKAHGRDRFDVFDATMRAEASERLALESALHRAVERSELSLAYQPIIDLRDGATVAVEALARWHRPSQGRVDTARFIKIAEDTGLIVPIGSWVLRQCCAQVDAWQSTGGCPVVHVNVSARQLRLASLASDLAAAAEDASVDPGRLCLEITETALMEQPEESADLLRAVKEHGFRVSVDDFGSGYSSLATLQRLPVDVLKIDRSFVAQVGHEATPGAAAIIAAIIDMSHALDLTVVAEGVETAQQLELLRDLGCDQAQGYLLARPGPAAEVLRG